MGYLTVGGKILGGLGSALTIYEGAKMIPYFTNQDSVLEDLAEKSERKITGKRDLNPLDKLRLQTSGLEDQYGKYMVPEQYGGEGLSREDAIERLLDKTKDDYETRIYNAELAKRKRKAKGDVEVAEAGKTPNEKELERLNRNVLEGEIDSTKRLLGLREQELLSNTQSRLAELDAQIARNTGTNSVAMAEIGLRQQAAEIARQERMQDKAAERRQAIFMALMALMG